GAGPQGDRRRRPGPDGRSLERPSPGSRADVFRCAGPLRRAAGAGTPRGPLAPPRRHRPPGSGRGRARASRDLGEPPTTRELARQVAPVPATVTTSDMIAAEIVERTISN